MATNPPKTTENYSALLFALTLGLYGLGRYYDVPIIRYTTAPIFALMVAAFLFKPHVTLDLVLEASLTPGA